MDASGNRHDAPATPEAAAGSRDMRVDQAHPAARAVATSSADFESAAVAAAAAEAAAWEAHRDEESAPPLFALDAGHLSLHATELAERLQLQQREIDHREARLNAQEAEFDNRLRNARLWVSQRESELDQRQHELSELEHELAEQQRRTESALARAAEVDARWADAAAREERCQRLEVELQVALTEQQTKLDALDLERATCRTREQELDAERAKYEHRQRQLDQREATLYTEQERLTSERIEFEGRVRQWTDREAALTSREVALRKWENQLREQASAFEFEKTENGRKVLLYEEQVAELETQERRLKFRQQEIETALRRFERLGIVEERLQEIERQADELAMRNTYLDHAEGLLAEQHVELQQQRDQLQSQRLAFENSVTRDRRALAAEQSQWQTVHEQRIDQLNRREQALDQREAALEKMAEQLRTTQRETLELRLAAEETWLQLQGALAPAALSRSVAQLRQRLAEHFHQAADDVDRRRGELETLRADLAEQLGQIEERRLRFTQWSEAQQRDLQERIERLEQRERDLEEQDRDMQRRAAAWRAERGAYRHEIQKMLGELRRPEHAAAA